MTLELNEKKPKTLKSAWPPKVGEALKFKGKNFKIIDSYKGFDRKWVICAVETKKK